MKRVLVALTLVFLVSRAAPVQAATPTIDAATFGIELCPQSICHAAIFAGVLYGQVGINPNAFGTFSVAVQHADLPDDPGEAAAILGGVFSISVGFRTIRGAVIGGSLEYNGDNTFTVRAFLAPETGGLLFYRGILDHNVFPPTVRGRIVTVS